jgi:pimeloyl-ACP methyl ester carboxylesterase
MTALKAHIFSSLLQCHAVRSDAHHGAAKGVDHVSSAASSCVICPGRRRPALRGRRRHPSRRSEVADAAQGDFAGLVDIGGGRRLYIECRGTGSPAVVLEAGYRSSARIWSEDLHQSAAPRPMVLAGVAAFTRVCAHDRPGTVALLNDDVRQSRSDPVAMPRTALDAVADLHALLRAAGVPGSYVFAGHSLGGLLVRLYASTYPRDVLGLVLVDAYSETLETLLTPERWAALVRLNVRSGSDTVKTIPSYGDLETIGYGKDK